MKNLVLLFALLSIGFIVSCGSDDSDDSASPDPQSDIVGTWTTQSAEISIQVDGVDIIQYFIDELGLPESEAGQFEDLFVDEFDSVEDIIWVFNADGTLEIRDPVEGNESGTYVLNNAETQITITADDETFTADVTTLTSQRLVMSYEETELEDIDDDGTNNTLTVGFVLTLVK